MVKYQTVSWHESKKSASRKAHSQRVLHPQGRYFVGKVRAKFRVIQIWR